MGAFMVLLCVAFDASRGRIAAIANGGVNLCGSESCSPVSILILLIVTTFIQSRWMMA